MHSPLILHCSTVQSAGWSTVPGQIKRGIIAGWPGGRIYSYSFYQHTLAHYT